MSFESQLARGVSQRETISFLTHSGKVRSNCGNTSTSCPRVKHFRMIMTRFARANRVELHRLSDLQKAPISLDPYVQNLENSKHRILLVNNLLESVQVREHNVTFFYLLVDVQFLQERLTRLNQHIARESARRKAMLDPSQLS